VTLLARCLASAASDKGAHYASADAARYLLNNGAAAMLEAWNGRATRPRRWRAADRALDSGSTIVSSEAFSRDCYRRIAIAHSQRHGDGGQDRAVASFRRAPYDPHHSVSVAGRATGLVVVHPPPHGWPRYLAFLLALALLSLPLLGIATLFGSDSRLYTDGPVVEGVRMLLFSSPFGFAGLLLLRRLVAQRGS